jgi:hypothetical protein
MKIILFRSAILALIPALFLNGCATGYSLVAAATPVKVAEGAMIVTPSLAWNKVPRSYDQPRYEEIWTSDGALLNSVTFYAGVPDGKALIRQRKSAERQAPLFNATMLPQEIAEFIESTYRVLSGSTVFQMQSLKPAAFAGEQGFLMEFTYILQSDELKRRGKAVGAVKDGKLYLVMLDAAATHYFDAQVAEFDRIVASAQVTGTSAAKTASGI